MPAAYRPLYDALDASLSAFETSVAGSWNGALFDVDFAAELTSASSSLGDRLLSDDHWPGVLCELDSLRAIGVKAVNVQIAFPVLYTGFYSSTAEYQRYLDFYERLAAEVRARNLKLIVRSSLIVSQQGLATVDVGAFYRQLSAEAYKSGRIETVRTVAERLRPDYLIVLGEPDTESAQAGRPELGTVEGSTVFVDAIVAAVRQSANPSITLGAGIGSWAPLYREYATSFSGTGVDFVVVHVYPGTRDFLSRTLEIADLVHARGKDVGVSEAWLQKVADGELGMVPVLNLFARDPFSFWAPLDTRFVEVMTKAAHLKRFAFFSPFWSQYLHAYVDYDPAAQLAPSQMLSIAHNAAAQSISDGQLTSTGVAYARAIAMSPDVSAPTTPGNVATYPLSSGAMRLSWDVAADDRGVAGYRVYRNDVLVGTTAHLIFLDTGLAASTRYMYRVVAYDVAGNVSPPGASVAGTTTSTPDTTPPSIPTGVFGRALSMTQIELDWNRSTDNVMVAGYRIYRDGVEVAMTTPANFSDCRLQPGTTYTYTIVAVDTAGNESAASVAASVPTYPRDTTPPSPPTSLMAYPARGIVYLVWGLSSDNQSVMAYHVFRNGVRLALAPGPYYHDSSVASSTTYTYAVLAFDPSGNVSAMSSPVTVTSLDVTRPSVPTGLTGQGFSTTQINLSWSPSTDNVKVSGYRVFRNGVQIADWGLTTYADRNLSPATQYTYHVAAIDSSGNLSGASSPAWVRTQAPDVTPPSRPIISAIAAISTTQINMAWGASTDNVRVAGYYLYRNGVKIASTMGTAWADTGLQPATAYVYHVIAYDAAGNMSAASASGNATTLRPPDTMAPSAPTGLRSVAVLRNQVTIAWTAAADNVAVTGYKVFRNNILIGISASPQYVDGGVFPGLTYAYRVSAYDAAGNVSQQSAGLTLTTPR